MIGADETESSVQRYAQDFRMVQDRGHEGSRQPRGRKLGVNLSNAYMLTE
jgi:hypothetical protein